jgi:hypothetical protein
MQLPALIYNLTRVKPQLCELIEIEHVELNHLWELHEDGLLIPSVMITLL